MRAHTNNRKSSRRDSRDADLSIKWHTHTRAQTITHAYTYTHRRTHNTCTQWPQSNIVVRLSFSTGRYRKSCQSYDSHTRVRWITNTPESTPYVSNQRFGKHKTNNNISRSDTIQNTTRLQQCIAAPRGSIVWRRYGRLLISSFKLT